MWNDSVFMQRTETVYFCFSVFGLAGVFAPRCKAGTWFFSLSPQ